MFVIGRSRDELWGVKWPLQERWLFICIHLAIRRKWRRFSDGCYERWGIFYDDACVALESSAADIFSYALVILPTGGCKPFCSDSDIDQAPCETCDFITFWWVDLTKVCFEVIGCNGWLLADSEEVIEVWFTWLNDAGHRWHRSLVILPWQDCDKTTQDSQGLPSKAIEADKRQSPPLLIAIW